jgi:branched-chain amino acid transport system permease protein
VPDKRTLIILLLIGAAAVIALPYTVSGSRYLATIVNQCLLCAIMALSLNVLLGFAGQVSLGQAGFVAVGAYTYALLAKSIPDWSIVALPVSMLAGGLVGAVIGIPALRMGGHYVVLGTMAFGEAVKLAFAATDATGGVDGIVGIPPVQLGSLSVHNTVAIYFLFLMGLFASIAVTWQLRRSHLGRVMIAIKDDELAAQSTGIDVNIAKMLAFVLSGVLGGLAGALYAATYSVVTPDAFDINLSLMILTMLILGGMGSIFGSIAGAVLLVVLPEVLRFSAQVYMVIYGTAIIALAIFLPLGINGLLFGRMRKALK